MSKSPELVLLTREACHLCHAMAALLDAELPKFDLCYAVRNVDDNPVWRERYGDVVPVLLRDGTPVAKIRLDRAQLKRIIRRRR